MSLNWSAAKTAAVLENWRIREVGGGLLTAIRKVCEEMPEAAEERFYKELMEAEQPRNIMAAFNAAAAVAISVLGEGARRAAVKREQEALDAELKLAEDPAYVRSVLQEWADMPLDHGTRQHKPAPRTTDRNKRSVAAWEMVMDGGDPETIADPILRCMIKAMARRIPGFGESEYGKAADAARG